MARDFDVWVQASNTIYRKVPFGVVTDWAQQGRLAGTDKLRAAGSADDWGTLADDPILSDFLFQKKPAATKPEQPSPSPAAMDVAWIHLPEDEDDDVDMIPLIDISLVLLIFFMMTAAVSALSPVEVPPMRHADEMSASANALTITIDKRPNGDADYALRVGEKAPAPED